MKYLRSFYKRHRGMAALALLLLLGQVVGTLLIPALIANVVDLGILPGIWMPFSAQAGRCWPWPCCRRRWPPPGAG